LFKNYLGQIISQLLFLYDKRQLFFNTRQTKNIFRKKLRTEFFWKIYISESKFVTLNSSFIMSIILLSGNRAFLFLARNTEVSAALLCFIWTRMSLGDAMTIRDRCYTKHVYSLLDQSSATICVGTATLIVVSGSDNQSKSQKYHITLRNLSSSLSWQHETHRIEITAMWTVFKSIFNITRYLVRMSGESWFLSIKLFKLLT